MQIELYQQALQSLQQVQQEILQQNKNFVKEQQKQLEFHEQLLILAQDQQSEISKLQERPPVPENPLDSIMPEKLNTLPEVEKLTSGLKAKLQKVKEQKKLLQGNK